MTAQTKKNNAPLAAESRENSGKGAARALRREGRIPATLYGKGHTPVSLSVPEKELTLNYQQGRFRSRIVELTLDGKTVQTLPRDVQFHPVTDRIEHVDFLKVDKDTTVRVFVPVKFHGQEKSMGLKRGGVLNIVRHSIEFICRPDAIPATIDLDITSMNIGDSLHINDVQLPENVTPAIKRNFTIATIAGRSTADEEAKPGADAAAAAPAAGAAPAKAEPAKKADKK